MAARPQLPAVETVDLRQVPPGSLDRLLDEETCAWREALAWDFSLSAALVKRFADMQSLAGMALVIGSRVIGYTYTVIDDDKGMVGDLYVLREFASPALEDHLLNATVETIATTSGIPRIESPIILLHHPRPKPLTSSRQPRLFERQFMVLDPRAPMPSGRAAHKLDFDTWHDRLQD